MDHQVQPQDQAASYELALDVLAQLIGHAGEQIDQEKAKPAPDATSIKRWQRQRDAWASRRRDLDPRDVTAVRAVLDQDGVFLRSLLEGGRE